MPAPVPVLDVRGLTVDIGRGRAAVRPVEDVSLRIEAGQTLGLVGESGSGKTMTGMSIMRLLPSGGRIVAGQVLVGGVDVTRLGRAAMRRVRGGDVAAVYQDPMTTLNPTMTIGGQIVEALRAHRRVSRREALERAADALGRVGIASPRERLGSYPFELSGGLRQRVVIAMALVCEPRLLIADEPTTALDVTIQAQLLDLVDDLRRALSLAVLLITHDMGVVAGRADRVAVMYAGRIVEEDDAVSIFARHRHPYTEALLASIPRPGQDKRTPLLTLPGLPPDLTAMPAGCRFSPRCAYVDAECAATEPGLREAPGDAGHRFACHHPVGNHVAAAEPATTGSTA
ncbi:MAG TPA: ABC transporter ATP-binding protein [Candidatus Dormibacteraeota bacterium]|nr:ABC transporter ATP-binding protein [Candidatus Dormibacteraeota bacterium]